MIKWQIITGDPFKDNAIPAHLILRRDSCPFPDNGKAAAHDVRVQAIGAQVFTGSDMTIRADGNLLIEDAAINDAMTSDSSFLHDHGVFNDSPFSDPHSGRDNGMFDTTFDNAAAGNKTIGQAGIITHYNGRP